MNIQDYLRPLISNEINNVINVHNFYNNAQIILNRFGISITRTIVNNILRIKLIEIFNSFKNHLLNKIVNVNDIDKCKKLIRASTFKIIYSIRYEYIITESRTINLDYFVRGMNGVNFTHNIFRMSNNHSINHYTYEAISSTIHLEICNIYLIVNKTNNMLDFNRCLLTTLPYNNFSNYITINFFDMIESLRTSFINIQRIKFVHRYDTNYYNLYNLNSMLITYQDYNDKELINKFIINNITFSNI